MPNSNAEKTFALFNSPINTKLVAELEKSGAKVLRFPPVAVEKIVLDENSLAPLKNPIGYDWMIFTDVLAVDFFLESLEETGVDVYELDATRVCALGETVSDRLRFAQLHADVIPPRVDAETVIASLKDYVGEDDFRELKFLVVKEESLDNEIINLLIETRAQVSELPVYRINLQIKGEIVKLKTLLKNGAVDEFVFSAPTDFIALKYFFDEESCPELLAGIKVSAVDGLTLQTVREHDLRRADLFRLEKIDRV